MNPIRHAALMALGLAAAGALLSCKPGVSSDPAHLDAPAIFVAQAARACGTAGSTAVSIDPVGTRVVLGVPQSQPPAGSSTNRVYVPGSVPALAAGESVYAAVLEPEDDCPIDGFVEVTPAADGTFTAVVDPATLLNFRIVAMTGPTGATVTCDAATGCVQLDVAGTTVTVSGMSQTIGVKLPL